MLNLREAVARVMPEAIEMRRFLHSHPELSGQELQTRSYICRKLEQWGIPYRCCTGNLGVIADVGKGEPCIAIRADMDALPVQEQTGLPYASQSLGIMHACGHDVHTAVLLALGRLLKEGTLSFPGTVRLLFQPGEETTGGAADMIREGCMEEPKVSAVLGFHVDPSLPVGTAAFCPGTMNAAATDFTLTVRGKGCHGAHPDEGVDAIVVSAQIVTALQSAVSRSIAPTDCGVVTVGTIRGGTKENIIADSVTMTGTVRALRPEVQERLKAAVRSIAEHTAEGFGACAKLEMDDLCPVQSNDDVLTRKMISVARELFGQNQTVVMEHPSLGSDDFAFFSDRVPGCYFNVGAHTEGIPGQSLHSPTFVPHEDSMETALLILTGFLLSSGASF